MSEFPDLTPHLVQDEGPSGPSLLARVVAALQGFGRLVATDWEIQTFEVMPSDAALDEHAPDGTSLLEPTAGVILPFAQRVMFYTVWPEVVPGERIPDIAELAHRVNTLLYTSALEFNLDSGMLSVRSGFEFDGLEGLPREVENNIVHNALLEAEAVYLEYRPAIQAVLDGRAALDALALVDAAKD